MNITIIGGGNIGTLMAVEFASKGHEITVCASDARRWSGHLEAYDTDDRLVCAGDLACVTDDLALSVRDAELVWVTHPTFMLETLSGKLEPVLAPSQWLGFVPGNDAELVFGWHVANGGTLFGLQRVHSVARLRERGRSVCMMGRRTSGLHIAAIPSSQVTTLAKVVEGLFDLPVTTLPNYLVETLTPSNPILHTTRIRSMFRDWKPGACFDRNILFYEEWDIPSSELLLACDDELQRVCRALESATGLDLSGVRSLREHYESPDAPSITAKISGIPGFKGLRSPMKEVAPGQWVPDFDSRYFKADFPYGLKVIKDIAALADVATPAIDEVYGWYRDVAGDTTEFDAVPKTLEELVALYT